MSRASEYRKRCAHEVELPSGAKFTLRRPALPQFMGWDALPTAFLQAAQQPVDPASISAEDTAQMARLMRDVLLWCCLDPRLSLEPKGDDEIHPSELSMDDALFIFRWAMRAEPTAADPTAGGPNAGKGGPPLRSFPDRPADADGGPDGAHVRPTAVRADGDPGAGAGPEF
jgi:hypothetical protein